jgi:hypothetical protein
MFMTLICTVDVRIRTSALAAILLTVLAPICSLAVTVDFSRAVIVAEGKDLVIAKSALMLQEELARRSGVTPPIGHRSPDDGMMIRIGTADSIDGVQVPAVAEAYGIAIEGKTINLVGHDSRGAMFAAGRLIRLADYGPGTLCLSLPKPIATAPDVPYRVHQLAYRNTANSYDAWTVAMYEQYIRDLILFGCNGVELIPNLDPDEKEGPVMASAMRAMNVKLAALIHSYGLEVWLWSPVMADQGEDVTTPAGAKTAWERRHAMFVEYPSIDHLFVPGGDDGDAPAEHLIPFLQGLVPLLREAHPEAKLWLSNQTFTAAENDYLFNCLEQDDLDWLTGVVYGPWTKMGCEEVRSRTPKRFQLRLYPDITHTIRCQYPVQDWDPVFANTVGREPMMPQPSAQRAIYLRYRMLADGFGTYSDGIHDDLNKQIWNALAWDPDADLDLLLEEYGKLWWGPALASEVAKGMRLLEENWKGPILGNESIPEALLLWESISKRCHDFDSNWRAQMYLFRARYDAYVQAKARAESRFEVETLAALAAAADIGVPRAIENARACLAQADHPIAPELRQGIEQLGPMLLRSIGYQLSVREPYRAKNPERGAMLDWLDQPVDDRPWLEQRFRQILANSDHEAQLQALDDIVHWTDPGPGGYYDNLGAVGEFAHVEYQQTWKQDPSGHHAPRVAFAYYQADRSVGQDTPANFQPANATLDRRPKEDGALARQELRMSWQSQIATHYGTPLRMRYEGLDPNARYRLKVTYAGRYRPTMTLSANNATTIHGRLKQPTPIWPVEYPLPRSATQKGRLELEWNLIEGRGCMVAEVWLMVDTDY